MTRNARNARIDIIVPRRAPAIVPKEERDALIAESSPYFVGNGHAVLSKIKCGRNGDSLTLLMVYVAYSNHVNKRTGEAFPSYSRLAKILGISTKTVGRALHELCDRGLLKIDRRMRAKSGRGYINVVRVIHAEGLTTADEQSIASYPQPRIGHLNVPHVTKQLRKGHDDVLHADQSVGINGHHHRKHTTPVSDIAHVQLRNGHTACPPELSELKNIRDTSIETPEQAIELWLAFAMKHGQHEPIANEDDLAIAHSLVDRHITAQQLETAVLPDPEAAHLRPLVRHLL